MPDHYDVERETEFNREKLQTAIPNRLQELIDIITSRKHTVDSWYADLITKILLSVDRICRDLLKTMEQEPFQRQRGMPGTYLSCGSGSDIAQLRERMLAV